MIVVVVDTHNSALGRAAFNRSKYQESIILAASDFISAKSLLKEIQKLAPKVVLFAFRNVLADALQLPECFPLISQIHTESHFGILIPDHLEIELVENSISEQAISSIDFILVTNLDLLGFYKERYGKSTFIDIYHDLVDYEFISKFRNISQIRQNKLIWVGNSKWGNRQGKIDHKGYFSIVSPLYNSEEFGDWEKKVIDSSKGTKEYGEVLRELSSSSALLHPSLSEGTGLPILESAILGVFPLTTRVGIAAELLGDTFPNLIIDRDLPSFKRCLGTINLFDNSERVKLVQITESFLSKVQNERIPVELVLRKETYQLKSNIRIILWIKVLWLYRYLNSHRK